MEFAHGINVHCGKREELDNTDFSPDPLEWWNLKATKRTILREGKKLKIGLGLVKLKMPVRHPGRNVKQFQLYKLKFR